MKVRSHIFDLTLKHTFGISRSAHDIQRTLIVQLEQNGYKGLGEVTENNYYGFTVNQMQRRLEELRPLIESRNLDDPVEFWDFMHPYLEHERFLHCAIDVAANDLFGRIHHKPLYEMWGLELSNLPLTNFTIALDTLEKMKEKLLEQPWPLYKIKLGTDRDLEIITALREISKSPFRIDANTAWSMEQTIKNSFLLRELGVEFIEQPLPPDEWDKMKIVRERSVLPVIADEACRTEEDVLKCKDSFTGINVKLAKAGGLTPARKMLIQARKLGLKSMVGCMTESSIGISAVGQLLPYLDFVDMDGALLLKNDIASGPIISYGSIQLPDRPGTGAEFREGLNPFEK